MCTFVYWAEGRMIQHTVSSDLFCCDGGGAGIGREDESGGMLLLLCVLKGCPVYNHHVSIKGRHRVMGDLCFG